MNLNPLENILKSLRIKLNEFFFQYLQKNLFYNFKYLIQKEYKISTRNKK